MYHIVDNKIGKTIMGPRGVVCITEAASLSELKDLIYYANRGIVVSNQEKKNQEQKTE